MKKITFITIAIFLLMTTRITVFYSCKKELKTQEQQNNFSGLRTIEEYLVSYREAVDTIRNVNFLIDANEEATAARSVEIIKLILEADGIDLPVSQAQMNDQFENCLSTFPIMTPDALWESATHNLDLTDHQEWLIAHTHEIFTQDFTGLSAADICADIEADAQFLIDTYEDSTWITENDTFALEVLNIIKSDANYCSNFTGISVITN